jgi:hypothetical protein
MRGPSRPRGKGRGMARACLAPLAATFAIALTPATASAAVDVYESSEAATHLATIEKAKCAVKGRRGNKHFVAFSESPNGWELDVYITRDFWGGVGDDYSLYYGVKEVGFDLYAPDGTLYSNQFAIPGTPPGIVSVGAIDFSRQGKRLGIGFSAAPDRTFTKGVAFAGVMKCKYKRRNRP